MKLSRPSLYAIGGLVAAAAVAAVLYGMQGGTVHADSAAPPAALAPFTMAAKAAAVPQVAIGDGSGVRLSLAAFKGHYVLLNLWAPWCAPCVKELPALARLKAAIPREQLAVVAVDVGRGSAADARRFLDAHDAKALDTYIDTNIALLRAFGAYGLPLTILIDPNGREIGRAVGPAQWDAKDSLDYFRLLTAARAAS